MTDPIEIFPPVAQPLRTWLRLEGLAVGILTIVLYAYTGASWWFFALWLAPDLSFLAYRAGPRIGAYCYNTVHSYLLPLLLAAAAMVMHRSAVLPCAILWCNHISVDRMLGYGLKYPAGFGFTHLQRLGKPKPATAPAPLP